MKELFSAMTKAFAAMENAAKDKGNPMFKNAGVSIKYATLESVVDAIKPALISNSLFFRQVSHDQPNGVCIETFVCHETGQELSFGKLFVPASKQDAQGYGSALTYARRYSLMAAFGICPEDDDGNAAKQISDNRQNTNNHPASPVEPINDAQWAELVTTIELAGVMPETIMAKLGISSLKDMPADKFASVTKKLNLAIDAKLAEKPNADGGDNG